METNLTNEEILFCELYTNGEAPFAGNAARCYKEAFNNNSNRCRSLATKLMTRKDIQEYLDKLSAMSYEDARYMKIFLRENLRSIVEECSSMELRDRKGFLISPAAVRSVAVNAAKALMELYPVKEAQSTKLSIEGAGEGGITFNVIMPSTESEKKED